MIKKTEISVFTEILFLSLLCSIAAGYLISDLQANITKSNAKPIIEALEKYHQDNNVYPNNLDELIPKYIDEIPRTKMGITGGNFKYYLPEKNDSYTLSFRETSMGSAIYNIVSKKWTFESSD